MHWKYTFLTADTLLGGLLVGCQSTTNQNRDVSSEDSVAVHREAYESAENDPETPKEVFSEPAVFEDNFCLFASDEEYQPAHIAFPMPYAHYDMGDDGPSGETIAQVGWRYLDFRQDSLAADREVGRFSIQLEHRADSVLYLRKGIDNGTNQEYWFKKVEKARRLSSLLDKSA